MSNWEKIPVGGRFLYDGNPVKKTGIDTFEDTLGIECQYQPLFDSKVRLFGQKGGPVDPNAPPQPGEIDNRQWLVDPVTRVMSKNPQYGKKVPKPRAKKTKKAETK